LKDPSYFTDKRILITGAAGTVGQALVERLATEKPAELRLLDNSESAVFFLSEKYRSHPGVICFLGDIRDREKVMRLARGIDVIFHCAAYKHVILSEYNPFDVVQTNVMGTQNVIMSAIECGVKVVINTSSDKAVNPTNVMGATKLLGEKLITAANAARYDDTSVFASTRFGNVIGSKGSVVPLFARQIRDGGPVTLTDRRMTRFVMSIRDSAELVFKSALYARGGEVFVTKMPVLRIPDLARAMVDMLAPVYGRRPGDIEIEEIGAKAGEKLYEELLTVEEAGRSLELREMFAILPAFKSIYERVDYEYPDLVGRGVDRPYVSSGEPVMGLDEVKAYLRRNRVLDVIEGEGGSPA
jgi:FlaA1/EpsC-like NDP-sugar epimerase